MPANSSPPPPTIESAAADLRAGRTNAVDLLDASLAAIEEHGGRTNAFIKLDTAGAHTAALDADNERKAGTDRGPLHGIPITVKDLIDIAGQPTTAASRVRADHVAERDALIVQRLRKAGAVIIGKTNLHEFALGTTSEETAFGPVHNPHDVTRSAGGSSGGSAAAVATGMGLASIGSDTGGSIRIPASACGIVGLKPSFGEVSVDGVVPLSVTFDHIGPLTRSTQDAAWLWAVLAGREIEPIEPIETKALTLGVLGGYFTALLGSEVRDAFNEALARLVAAGVTLEARAIEHADAIVETYTNISLPEAALWHAETLASRSADYHPAVLARLEKGREILAVDHLRARDMRVLFAREVDTAFENCHALVLPTLPIIAPTLGAVEAAIDSDQGETLTVRAAMLRLTQLFNVTGHPAISLPIGTKGLPVGLQLVGRRDATADLLAVALAVEGVI